MDTKNISTIPIIVTTGGTGGHIFPALAVASALQKYLLPEAENLKGTKVEVIFVGALYGKEKDFAQKAGLEFYGLNVRGLKGRGLAMISAAFSMLKAIKESYIYLGKVKPKAVIGFGGYACFATVFAAKLRSIPCLIHEQNAIPGLANKVLSHLVNRICLSLPDTNQVFNEKKCVLTGNPVREEIAAITPYIKAKYKAENPHKYLFVMGGSLGATSLNSLLINMLDTFRDKRNAKEEETIHIIHQCGEKDYARVKEAYKSYGFSQEEIDTMLFPFIDDMASCYKKADLALCRAGATSIAELTVTGTPSVLIPFPYAANDHQTENAKNLEKANAALLFSEAELKSQDIKPVILDLLNNQSKLNAMSQNTQKQAQHNAAEKIADIIFKEIRLS